MVKYFLILIVCIGSTQVRAQALAGADTTFSLLCLNAWMIPFKRRKANTRSRLIGKYSRNYDFVMLQEVFNRRQRRLITREINRKERFDNRYQRTPFLRINSGVFNLSKYEIVKSSFKRFSRCGGAQCLSGKGVLHTRVKLPAGIELDIYNTHLQPFKSGESIRRHQINEILRHIEKTNDGKRAVVLVGDFNVSASREEHPMFEKQLEDFGFADAWKLMNHGEPGYTWDSNINTWSRRTDRSIRSQHRFDYIFVKDGSRDKIELLSSEVVFDEPLSMTSAGRKYFLSDHFGVDIEFRIHQSE